MARLGCALLASIICAACLDDGGGVAAEVVDASAEEALSDASDSRDGEAIADPDAGGGEDLDAAAGADAGEPGSADAPLPGPEVHDAAAEVEPDAAADTGPADATGCPMSCSARRPLVLVHGINGSPANFDVMAARLVADGWPEDWVVRFAAADPAWGCNVDNAAALAALVEEVRRATCQARVDIVAHSMGTLSSRYYVKNLGGSERVNTYVTLGGMHHGLLSPCFAPDFLGVCVWKELCQWGEYITQLNADPATPGALHWVSIYGTADETVSNESSHLEGAENIAIEGAEHDGVNGLLQREDAYAEVLRVLGYPCW